MKTGTPSSNVHSEALPLQMRAPGTRAPAQPASNPWQHTPRQQHQARLIESMRNGATVSNQATQLQRLPGPASVQMKKDEAERGDKHRRVQEASQTIAALGNNVRAGLHGHVFNALPIGGGALDPAHPTGLHAYTNGALPAGITRVAVHGSTGRIHTLTWRATAGATTKDSTMFPIWMPATHVNTLMALKYAGIRQNAVPPAQIHPDATKTHIQHGQQIYDRIVQVGETVYPQ